MKTRVNDAQVCLRFSRQLLSDARAKATKKGMSLNGLVRYLLHREIDAIDVEPIAPSVIRDIPLAKIDPNGAIGAELSDGYAAAGLGNLEAIRATAAKAYNDLVSIPCEATLFWLTMGHAISFARLAASHRQIEDIRRLAMVMRLASLTFTKAGDHTRAEACDAECTVLCEYLAEHGDDGAAVTSHELISARAPAFLKLVRGFQQQTTRNEEAA